MLKFNNYILLIESKSREKNIEKQRQKIKKFLNNDEVISLVFDILVDKDSTKGLKYTIWLANQIKIILKKLIIKEINDSNVEKDNINIETLKIYGVRDLESFVENYFRAKKFDYIKKKYSVDKKYPPSEFNLKKKLDDLVSEKLKKINIPFSNFVSIRDWLKSPLTDNDNIDINKYSLESAFRKSEEWHNTLKATGIVANETGTVIMTFEDGWYWIDLNTSSCSSEANAMGHCATTEADTMLSLRLNQSPHVTVAYDYDGTVYQIKGRNNDKPTKKYYKYIKELIASPNVANNVKLLNNSYHIKSFSTEYSPENDFHLSDLENEEVIDLIERNKKILDSLDFRMRALLYEIGVFSGEDFVENYNDLYYKEGKIILGVSDWGDFTNFKSENESNWRTEILTGNGFELFDYSEREFDFSYNYGFSEGCFDEIIEYIETNKLKIIVQDDSEEVILISKQNTYYKDNEAYLKTSYDVDIPFKDIIENIENDEFEMDEIYFNYLDGDKHSWVDLFDIFTRAYNDTQNNADESEAYNNITDVIIDELGPLTNIKIKTEIDYYLFFELKIDNIVDIWDKINIDGEYEESYFNTILEIINTSNGDWVGFDVSEPYYGFNGTIKTEYLEENIIQKLSE